MGSTTEQQTTIDASGPAPQSSTWALAIHGGAGAAPKDLPESELALTRNAMRAALAAGAMILATGGSSLDAVQAAVRILENCGVLNAGRGAVLNHEGFAELDACVMDGNGRRVGAVAGLRQIANPIDLARRVMEHGRHVLLAGPGAEQFATEQGVAFMPASYFITERRRQQLEAAIVAAGTVGAVALDAHGNLAAATSTGGLTNKHYGRVGDSPIVGAGTFAENGVCAISATGDGEFFIRHTVASEVSARIRYQGKDAETAAREVIEHLKSIGGIGGLIAVDAAGRITMPYSSAVMPRGQVSAGLPPLVLGV
jgi:L-asparaginase / beta-aspartyl-peptidase